MVCWFRQKPLHKQPLLWKRQVSKLEIKTIARRRRLKRGCHWGVINILESTKAFNSIIISTKKSYKEIPDDVKEEFEKVAERLGFSLDDIWQTAKKSLNNLNREQITQNKIKSFASVLKLLFKIVPALLLANRLLYTFWSSGAERAFQSICWIQNSLIGGKFPNHWGMEANNLMRSTDGLRCLFVWEMTNISAWPKSW